MGQGLLKRSKDMNSYLLIGLESLIDHIGSIRDLGIVYWKKANKKMQIGDIVYLFISAHPDFSVTLPCRDTEKS